MGNGMRDATSEARDGMRDMGRAAGAASGDLQKDLQMLRDDFSRLAQQVADIVANRGNAAWQRARSGVDGVMSDAQEKSQEAVDAMREVSDKLIEAVDDSIKNRPYTTLAMAVGLGFLFGAILRR
ncbi:MAG: DUF883 family protein [Xanthobacteraceae bacterium]|jgi:ElaB/YqjD/DUF883 family membrane-anchored ribosome-binding protein